MSYLWSFLSFSDNAFWKVFGHSTPQMADKFLDSAAYAPGDVSPEIAHASRSMLMSGVSYDGLSPNGARALDEAIKLAFSSEGLESELEVEHLSPDGIHPSVIDELMQRLDAPAPLLACLLRGRRFGRTEPVACEYCIFRSDEVSAILHETRNACAANRAWSADYMSGLVQECLVEPFEIAQRTGRPVFCILS
jgi:hypothetical protein